MRWRTRSADSACPKTKTTSAVCPGARVMSVITAAQGSSSGPDAAGQADAAQRGGRCRRAVAAEKLGAIGGEGMSPRADAGEGNPRSEGARPGAAGQHGACLRVVLAHDLQRGVVSDSPEDPLGVIRRRQPSRTVANISHGQAHELDWVVEGDQREQFLIQAVATVVRSDCIPGRGGRSRPPRRRAVREWGSRRSPVSSSRR